jgi:hypothetical protein
MSFNVGQKVEAINDIIRDKDPKNIPKGTKGVVASAKYGTIKVDFDQPYGMTIISASDIMQLE